ncbi:hypothetical protein CVT26_006506 [Gymnopilus dilepis]|uniref:Uncharacterized protein n=1 Tax=Gymnopilus dilepis TaxID=231916 RepID=A0A409W6G8_9AGAR|nr:hypothetical protein CVT26_006506 [Gymnopilus dilepis]
MRFFQCLSFLCAVVVLSVAAKPTSPPAIRRFPMRGTPVRAARNMTQAELYARALTLRKPTRRSTAQRRQTSNTPVTRFASVSVKDSTTGTVVGNLVMGEVGWSISSGGSAPTFKNTGTSATVQTQQQLTWSDAPANPYTSFGIGQCSAGASTNIGAGSAAVLCLVNARSQVPAGSTPTAVATNLLPGGTGLAETGVWTLDYATNVATPQWINPDGTTPTTYIVENSATGQVYVTGDVNAASQALGATLVPITLSFTATTT